MTTLCLSDMDLTICTDPPAWIPRGWVTFVRTGPEQLPTSATPAGHTAAPCVSLVPSVAPVSDENLSDTRRGLFRRAK